MTASRSGAALSAPSIASATAGTIKSNDRATHDAIGDLDLFARLGLRTLRYPVLWERVAPVVTGSARLVVDAIAGWRECARSASARSPDCCITAAARAYTSLIDPQFPQLLAQFAEQVATRYPWIRDYTPVNEPLTTARFSGLYGVWYPHCRSDKAFVRALLNQAWGIVLAMQAMRRVNPAARLIQTEDCGRCYGTAVTNAPGQVRKSSPVADVGFADGSRR